MTRLSHFSFFVLILFCAEATAALPERSISASRQFIVYGEDRALRGGICDLAERIKKDALTLLHPADRWTTPILIHAQRAHADAPDISPARLQVSQTGFGLKIQLDLNLRSKFDPSDLERELLRAILLEIMYRAEPNISASTAFVEPPDWLLEGMLAIRREGDTTALVDALAPAVTTEKIIPLAEFLRQKPALLESPSRIVYRAYAVTLISLLKDGAGGRERLTMFVTNLATASNDPFADLLPLFSQTGSDGADKMQAVWKAAVLRFSRREGFQLFAVEETERQLADLLRVEIPKAGQTAAIYSLEEFPNFIREPAAKPALQRLMSGLSAFSVRVNPLYRPVIAEYQEIVGLLQRGKQKRIAQRLAEVRGTREHLRRRMSAIGDYMNWFEATQAHSASGAFQEYLKAAELAQERTSRRRDPISVYLDALEAQF